jgi:hypothetical protein
MIMLHCWDPEPHNRPNAQAIFQARHAHICAHRIRHTLTVYGIHTVYTYTHIHLFTHVYTLVIDGTE